MFSLDIDDLILAAAADEVSKQPINGVNLWEIPDIQAARLDHQRQSYRVRFEQSAVERTCEACGKVWLVHPLHAYRVRTCSSSCATVMHRRRKKGEPTPDRPLWKGRWKNI